MADSLIRFPCPKCGKRLKAPADRTGSRVTCSACGEKMLVPGAAPPADAVPWFCQPADQLLAPDAPRVSPAPPAALPAPRALPDLPDLPSVSRSGPILILGGVGLVVVLGLVLLLVVLFFSN